MNDIQTNQSLLWDTVRRRLQAQQKYPPITPVNRDEPLPASFAQQRLWFIEQLSETNSQHNLCVAFDITGTVNIDAFEQALTGIIQRHEVLRTSFYWQAGRLWQRVHPLVSDNILLQQKFVGTDSDREELELLEASRPFDITLPPLLRSKIYFFGEQKSTMLLSFHHLAFDGWSFEIFMSELTRSYRALIEGQPSPFSDLHIQYADFAFWQRQCLTGQTLQHLKGYWQQQLADPPAPLSLSSRAPDRHTPQHSVGCSTFAFTFTPQLSRDCKVMASQSNMTIFMLLLAAFQILLYRHSGENDIIVGVPVANRNTKELKGLIGLLLNILPIRGHIQGEQSCQIFLAQIRQTILDAYAHSELPFEIIIESLQLPRQINRSPLLQVMFSYLNVPQTGWEFPGLTVSARNIHNGSARFDLQMSMWEKAGCLGGQLEYDRRFFDERDIASLSQQWSCLLESLIANPDCPINALPLLTKQHYALASLATGPEGVYPREKPVHSVFESVVKKRQHEPALIFNSKTINYAKLNAQANQLAHFMAEQGVNPGSYIALYLPPSPHYIIALLATLKLGAIYIPIEPSESASRIEIALRGATITATIGISRQLLAPVQTAGPVLLLDLIAERLKTYPTNDPQVAVPATNVAYVMFTSGSTGIPKAVCVRHRGIVRLACAANYAKLNPESVFLQLAPLAFDFSTFEIWGALLNGAQLVIPDTDKPSLLEIAHLVRQHKVTTLGLSTGLFEVIIDTAPDILENVHQLLVGGDRLSPKHAASFLLLNPDGQLINGYGPTENTTFSSSHRVTLADINGSIPIGNPLSHSAIYVLDELYNPVPRGVIGTAWLAGDGLMAGYLNNSDANQCCLRPNPFSADTNALMYDSGDLMRMRTDGILEFIGRKDRQRKVRGYRVEPVEIETLLLDDLRISQACVVVDDSHHHQRLLAFVVIKPDYRVVTVRVQETLKDLLCAKLPEPLRPSEIMCVETLPLNANGKLDRRALQQFRTGTSLASEELPANETERKIIDVYHDLLEHTTLNRNDSFFDFGGNSLLALQLLLILEQHYAIKIPLANLFKYPTPARMAEYIEKCQKPLKRLPPEIIEIRPSQTEDILFLVPGGHGGMIEMSLYARVMDHVTTDIQVLGLLADSAESNRPLPASVSEMASTYIQRIKILQPEGPYFLAGECVGGTIAYETGQQLSALGDQVFVVLMDTWYPTLRRHLSYRWLQRFPLLMGLFLEKLNAARKDFFGALVLHIRHGQLNWRYVYDVVMAQARIAHGWFVKLRAERILSEEQCANNAKEQNYTFQAMHYRPKQSSFALDLIVSSENMDLGLSDDWHKVARLGIKTWVAPGTHESYLRQTPKESAVIISRCLDHILQKGGRHARIW